MNKELKYPIKYAVLELKERGGWADRYEDITQGFIVSKCYVVGSRVLFFANGESQLSHKVVFPYKDISNFKTSLHYGRENIGEPTIPSYDASGKVYPVDIVTDLFDNYDEAKELSQVKNKELQSKLILKVSISDPNWKAKYEKLQQEFSTQLATCQMFEQLVSLQTSTMNISENNVNEHLKLVRKNNNIL